jgi:uncharacterized protein
VRELLEYGRILRYKIGMNREHAIAILRSHEQELRHRGVLHAALFGSVARNEAKAASDIDILIEIEPSAPIDMLEYIGITHYLADLFPGRVDVANRSRLKPFVKPSAERDAVYAF